MHQLTTSTMPPAEKATIARIGLVGQACAHVAPLAKARPRTDSTMEQIRVMSVLARIEARIGRMLQPEACPKHEGGLAAALVDST